MADMTEYAGKTDYITELDDLPNDEGGVSPDQLKALFDQGLIDFKTWFNSTHKTQFDALAVSATVTAQLTELKHRQLMEV